MRRVVLVGLVAALASGCSGGVAKKSAGFGPSLPLLRTVAAKSSVAALPCPKHPETTLDMEACAARHALIVNARVDAKRREIWRLLGAKAGRASFASAERSWAVYRRELCIARARGWIVPGTHQYAGGTISPVEFASCEQSLTAVHLRELNATAQALAPK